MEYLRPATTGDFDEMYALLQESFPVDEYRPYEAQKSLLFRPEYTAYILSEADRIHALITLWTFGDFIFIEHFAVAPHCRNHGLGSRILQQLQTWNALPLCLEAELPVTPLAMRRQAFYCRNGFSVNDFPYLQPAYAPDRHPVPMQLLTTGSAVSQERILAIRDCLYRHVYNAK